MHFRWFADAIAFEVACEEDAQLQFSFVCDGRTQNWTTSARDIMAGSTVTYMEEIPPTNNGSYWRFMESVAKIKVHQGWSTDRLTLDLTYEDAPADLCGADFYYVRVIQRNGQRAWSSPIWITR